MAAGQIDVGELHTGSALMAAPGSGEPFEFDADVAGLDGFADAMFDIDELEKRMWKDRLRLKRIRDTIKAQGDGDGDADEDEDERAGRRGEGGDEQDEDVDGDEDEGGEEDGGKNGGSKEPAKSSRQKQSQVSSDG